MEILHSSEERSLGSVFSSLRDWLGAFACGLLGLAWLVANHYRPWVTFHSEFVALAGLVALLASCLVAPAKRIAVPALAAWVACVAVTPWIQLAAGISLFAGDAVLSSLYLVALAGAITAGHHWAQEGGSMLPGLAHVLWLAALLSAFIGLMQWLGLQEWLGSFVVQVDLGDRALGNVGQPNQLATLLLMGMAALALVFERRSIGLLAFAVGVLFMTWVLVLTQSRSGILGLILSAAFLLVKSRNNRLRIKARHLGCWVAFFVGASLAFPVINDALMLDGARGSFGTTSDRLLIWSQVIDGIFQSPWVGYGWNQTSTAHVIGAEHHPGDITYIYAHNLLLDLLAWVGLPAGFVLIGFGLFWFCSRMRRVAGGDAVYAMAALLPFILHSMLEFPFSYAYFLVWAGLFAGVIEAAVGTTKVFELRPRVAAAGLLTTFVIGTYLSYEYLLIEEDFRIVRFENLRLGSTESDYQVPKIWMNSHMAAMLKAARQRAKPGMTAQQMHELKNVAMRFPWGALTFRYAVALGLNNDPEGASRMMKIIYGMYGMRYYAVVREELREMTKTFPQLTSVRAPETF